MPSSSVAWHKLSHGSQRLSAPLRLVVVDELEELPSTHIDLAYEGSGKATIQLTMCRNASIVLELFRGHFALIGR